MTFIVRDYEKTAYTSRLDFTKRVRLKKNFFSGYADAMKDVASRERKLEEIVTKIRGLHSPRLSDMPKSAPPDSAKEELIDKKIRLESQLAAAIERAKSKKQEIQTEIDAVGNFAMEEFLNASCIELKTYEKIAEEKNYSVRQTWRIFKEIFEDLVIVDIRKEQQR